jgi:hypothetical protein
LRLIVVDAARSFGQLRLKYPDPVKHLILRALVRASTAYAAGKLGYPIWQGRVESILPSEIYVSLPYSMEFNRQPPEEIFRYLNRAHATESVPPHRGLSK